MVKWFRKEKKDEEKLRPVQEKAIAEVTRKSKTARLELAEALKELSKARGVINHGD